MSEDYASYFELHVLFDDEANKSIAELCAVLEGAGLTSIASSAHGRYVPHLPIAAIAAPPDDSSLKKLERLKSSLPKALTFHTVAMRVENSISEVFVAPNFDRALVSALNESQLVLKFDRHDPAFASGSWIARSPLAFFDEAAQARQALDVVAATFVGFTAQVRALSFVERLTGMVIPVF